MLILKHAQFRFLRSQFCARLIELILKKFGRVLGTLLSLFQIFRDEQIREFARRHLRHLRIAIRVINVEGGQLLVVAVRQFDFDILAHLVNQLVGILVLPIVGIETEGINDVDEGECGSEFAA